MTPNPPQLLVDTDAFCKLAVADLLDPALALLGISRERCARLPTLPHMLRRGRIAKRYSCIDAARLLAIASTIPTAPDAAQDRLEEFIHIEGIDPGEAQLFALAAEKDVRLISGDKRAIAALSPLTALHPHLNGKVITLEATLLLLAHSLSDEHLREKGQAMVAHDNVAKAVFSSTETPVAIGLRSYDNHVRSLAHPLILWSPFAQGGA